MVNRASGGLDQICRSHAPADYCCRDQHCWGGKIQSGVTARRKRRNNRRTFHWLFHWLSAKSAANESKKSSDIMVADAAGTPPEIIARLRGETNAAIE
jgi:hypothetical protein